MNLLSFDTSTTNLSLSFFYKDKFVVSHNENVRFGSSKLVARIQKYLKKFHLVLKDFDALVVGRGPGSFTGLRIGFSVAKAFSVSSGIPVISLGSFFSIAYGFRGRYDKIAVIGDARKGLAYTAAFAVKKGKIAITEKEKLCDLASFIKNKDGYFLVTSDANLIEQSRKLGACSLFHPAPFYPDAKNLAMLAQDLFVKKKFTPLDKLEPLYLHPKTCQIR